MQYAQSEMKISILELFLFQILLIKEGKRQRDSTRSVLRYFQDCAPNNLNINIGYEAKSLSTTRNPIWIINYSHKMSNERNGKSLFYISLSHLVPLYVEERSAIIKMYDFQL